MPHCSGNGPDGKEKWCSGTGFILKHLKWRLSATSGRHWRGYNKINFSS
jgi:hypothetical protein